MQIVVDTNVIFSGIFFHGPPGKILENILTTDLSMVSPLSTSHRPYQYHSAESILSYKPDLLLMQH